ncbi:MAG: hypothetical protein RIQ63_1339 [Actinomycetota bacterium]
MLERFGDINFRQLVTGLAAERPAARGENQGRQFALRRLARTQALVHCAVLAVDGHDDCTGRATKRLHHGAGGDEALFVGECEALAATQCFEGDRQAGKTHNSVYDDVGISDDVGNMCDELHVRELTGQFLAHVFINHRHDTRPVLGYLFAENLLVRRRSETDHFVSAM